MGRHARDRRAARPRLHEIEPRELLSGLIVALSGNAPTISASAALQKNIIASEAGGSGSSGLITGLGNGFGPGNMNSPLLGQGTPTPQELARMAYKAGFNGRYYTGPGRFSDQGTTYFYRGLGGSTYFLHGDFDMAIVTPSDPTKPFIGEAVLQDKNTNSGAIQGLILRGDRTKVDALGRPTQLQFVADPNIYSGAYFVEAAEGTVEITYGSGPNHPVHVTFTGLVYTTGLTNPLVNQDLYARHGRPLRFR
jgi:hypothetical protein